MNNLVPFLIRTILIGLGATLTTDVWAMFLKRAFKVTPPNYRMVGRWILYVPEGIVIHPNIGSAPQKSAECTIGWVAHYMTGIVFAVVFVAFTGNDWLQHPGLISALVFGIFTVTAPFLIMQPGMGAGVAASRTPDPNAARLRSLTTHAIFGLGLYVAGWARLAVLP